MGSRESASQVGRDTASEWTRWHASQLRFIVTDRYSPAVAAHYAAYRPPLHARLLARVLGDRGPFDVGLDVGCGTGRSTVALAAHCARVYGVDDPFPALRARLAAENAPRSVGATLYYAAYRRAGP